MVSALHSVCVCVMNETWGEIWCPFTVYCHPGARRTFGGCFYWPKKRDISAAFGVGTGALVKAESYRGRLC